MNQNFESWLSEHGDEIEREWQFIHDEYGDAAPLFSDFQEQRYGEALIADPAVIRTLEALNIYEFS